MISSFSASSPYAGLQTALRFGEDKTPPAATATPKGRPSRAWVVSLLAAGSLLGVGADRAEIWMTTPNPMRVQKVHDGDTFTLNNGQEIRIWGIDSPELKQQLGPEAQKHLEKLLSRSFLGVPLGTQEVKIHVKSNSFGRKVAEVFVGGNNIGKIMIKDGKAYAEPKYSKDAYKDIEAEARENRLGVWEKDPNGGIRPWDFRTNKK